MKLSMLQQDLIAPLQTVARSVASRPTLPVLANVLLQAESGKLKLSATNLELGVIKTVKAEVKEDGEITVPARTFVEVVTSLSGETIDLESDGEQLTISMPHFKATLNGITASEFPTIPLSSDRSISVSPQALQVSIPEVAFAAASEEGRPVLTGILTEIKKHALELVATDGFRLAHKTAPLVEDDKDVEQFKALIPRRTFEEVIKVIAEESTSQNEVLNIATSENQIIFTIGDTSVSSRLIEGQFPAWEKIMPTKSICKVVLDRGELLKAVKLASVFARGEQSNIIKLEVKGGNLTVLSEAREIGGQVTQLTAIVSGEQPELLIAFNNRFLADALANSRSREVVLEFSGVLSATLIKPVDEPGLEYVVMPVRLS